MSNCSTNPYRFTSKDKCFLRPGEYMRMGEFLFSPDGAFRLGLTKNALFTFQVDPVDKQFYQIWKQPFKYEVTSCFAILQTDGNFCVYEGRDPAHQGPCLWSPNVFTGRLAYMQLDGNFCIYNRTTPATKMEHIVWHTNRWRPVADHYEFSDIIYDYDHKKILSPTIEMAQERTISNKSSVTQTTQVDFQVKKTEKHSWETSSSSKMGIKSGVKIKVPFVGEFGVEISGEFTTAAAEGKEIITEQTITYSFPAVVPKMTIMKVKASVEKETLFLPYSSKGAFRLLNGEESYCELEGEFKVNGASKVHISYEESPIKQGSEEAENLTCAFEVDGQKQQVSVFPLPDICDFGKSVVIDPSLITIL